MNILLLEPAFKNKYPPLSLMKIAAFHRNNGDEIYFRKGPSKDLPEDISWDRIYISTLFTFAWPETCDVIDFALKQNVRPENIYIGGGVATLETEAIQAYAPHINVVTGLLNEPGKLNLPGDETIDAITPDYSILEQIDHKYAMKDAYFLYSTRGCGMGCSFCAVDRLEPEYFPYIPIQEQVNAITERTGLKRHLMLMDNNVLKSQYLEQIVDDICQLGFAKGASMINPKSGKLVKRTVDFNQGLDANFLTAEKAELLSRIALEPVRIAFDHIGQRDRYLRAIRTCFNAGLRKFSNYLLYNSDEASWKGISYGADNPAGLYERLEINVNLQQQLQAELKERGIKETVGVYSFPMRYIPLDNLKRGYVGTNWNPKYLRGVQALLTPTQGKGVSSPAFFRTAFGNNAEEFVTILQMPEKLIMRRGRPNRQKSETDESYANRLESYDKHQTVIESWKKIRLDAIEIGLWDDFFVEFIQGNSFHYSKFEEIKHDLLKILYHFYWITPTRYKQELKKLSPHDSKLISEYIEHPENEMLHLFENWK